MLEASMLYAAPVDLLTTETVGIVGPVGTVIGVILGLYWALQREGLVTGKAHRREIVKLADDLTRERVEYDATIKAMREDHHARIKDIREDWERQAARREAENAATIAGLRADVARLYGAWQITEHAAERVVTSRIQANDETIITLMEAIRRSQSGERLELPTTNTIGSAGAADDDRRAE